MPVKDRQTREYNKAKITTPVKETDNQGENTLHTCNMKGKNKGAI